MKPIDFLEIKTKRSLIGLLKDKEISFEYVEKNALSFDINFSGVDYSVCAAFFKDEVRSYVVSVDFKDGEYERSVDAILSVKKDFDDLFEKPAFDNTNHLDYNNVFVFYETNDWVIELICENFFDWRGRKSGSSIIFTNINVERSIATEKKKGERKNNLPSGMILYGSAWFFVFLFMLGIRYGFGALTFLASVLGGIINGAAYYLLKKFSERKNLSVMRRSKDETFVERSVETNENAEINENETSELFDRLKKAVVEYNPYKIYDTKNNDCLDEFIMLVTKELLNDEDPSKRDLKPLVYNTFGIYFFEDYDLSVNLTTIFTSVYSDYLSDKTDTNAI